MSNPFVSHFTEFYVREPVQNGDMARRKVVL